MHRFRMLCYKVATDFQLQQMKFISCSFRLSHLVNAIRTADYMTKHIDAMQKSISSPVTLLKQGKPKPYKVHSYLSTVGLKRVNAITPVRWDAAPMRRTVTPRFNLRFQFHSQHDGTTSLFQRSPALARFGKLGLQLGVTLWKHEVNSLGRRD